MEMQVGQPSHAGAKSGKCFGKWGIKVCKKNSVLGVGCLNVLAQGSQPGLVCTFFVGFSSAHWELPATGSPSVWADEFGFWGGSGGDIIKGDVL